MRNIENADRVLRSARSWLGTPYLHQASLKHVGCDCLGLVRGIWRETEGREPQALPGYSSAWSELSGREQLLEASTRHFVSIDKSAYGVGDLLVFRMRPNAVAKHIGITASNTTFIHAYDGSSVVESALSRFWRHRITAAFRFPGVELEGMR